MTKTHVLLEKGVKSASLELMESPCGGPQVQPAHGLMAFPSPRTTFHPGFHSICSRLGENLLSAMAKNSTMTSVSPKQQVSLSHSEKSCGQHNYPSRRLVHSDIMSGFPCPSPAPLKRQARCPQSLGKALLEVGLVGSRGGEDI